MRCKWSAPDAERLAIAVMAPAEAEAYRAHLSGCSDCQAEVGRSERLEAAVRAAFSEVAIPAGAVERMLARLPARVPAPALWRRRPVRYAAALAGAVAILFVVVNPQAVISLATTVRQTFYFIPGIGIRPTGENALVLEAPVQVTHGEVTFRVSSVLVDSRATIVQIQMLGVPSGGTTIFSGAGGRPGMRLRDGAGRIYQRTGVELTTGRGRPVGGTVWFPALPPDTRTVTVDFDSLSPWLEDGAAGRASVWQVQLSLVPPSESGLSKARQPGSAVSLHGITVRADQVAQVAGSTSVHLSVDAPGAFRIDRLVVSKPWEETQLSGWSFGSQAAPSRTFDFYSPVPQSTLRIERIEMTEQSRGSVEVVLPDSRAGNFDIGRSVALGRHTLHLVRGEMTAGGRTLRVYYQTQPAVDGRRLWANFPKQSSGGSYREDEGTGYFYVNLNALNRFTKRVVLDFENPRVLVEGPWELPFD
jgi:hypothetical protein